MSKPLVVRRLSAVVVCVLALLATEAAGAAGARPGTVWFLRDGRPVAVQRSAPTLPAVVKALLAGPTAAERRRGLRSAIPATTKVRNVRLSKRIATVDLAARFAQGVDRDVMRDRADQVVRTVLGVPGVAGVRLRIEGGVPVGLFPGYDLRRPVTAPYAPPAAAPPTTRGLQQTLADLGFMDPRAVTGSADSQTATAVLGFQKWIGLPRDGLVTEPLLEALATTTRPQPALRAPGRRIEVQLDRQLALLIDNGRVERVVHISSGAFGKTPEGTFSVYRKERYSWSVPFKVWLPWASYFTGGVAFHEFGSVPTYAASHGCVRVNHYDAQMLYEFARPGTQVDVFHEARV
jgi:hypothetical protein